MDWFQLEIDLAHFMRNIRLKLYFNQHKSQNVEPVCYDTGFCYADFHLTIRSDFSPTVSSNAIDTFYNLVKKDIETLKNEVMNNIKHPNISREEMEALRELAHNTNVTIKPGDKGGGIVIMDTPKIHSRD